jgi:hypothetical protein
MHRTQAAADKCAARLLAIMARGAISRRRAAARPGKDDDEDGCR